MDGLTKYERKIKIMNKNIIIYGQRYYINPENKTKIINPNNITYEKYKNNNSITLVKIQNCTLTKCLQLPLTLEILILENVQNFYFINTKNHPNLKIIDYSNIINRFNNYSLDNLINTNTIEKLYIDKVTHSSNIINLMWKCKKLNYMQTYNQKFIEEQELLLELNTYKNVNQKCKVNIIDPNEFSI